MRQTQSLEELQPHKRRKLLTRQDSVSDSRVTASAQQPAVQIPATAPATAPARIQKRDRLQRQSGVEQMGSSAPAAMDVDDEAMRDDGATASKEPSMDRSDSFKVPTTPAANRRQIPLITVTSDDLEGNETVIIHDADSDVFEVRKNSTTDKSVDNSDVTIETHVVMDTSENPVEEAVEARHASESVNKDVSGAAVSNEVANAIGDAMTKTTSSVLDRTSLKATLVRCAQRHMLSDQAKKILANVFSQPSSLPSSLSSPPSSSSLGSIVTQNCQPATNRADSRSSFTLPKRASTSQLESLQASHVPVNVARRIPGLVVRVSHHNKSSSGDDDANIDWKDLDKTRAYLLKKLSDAEKAPVENQSQTEAARKRQVTPKEDVVTAASTASSTSEQVASDKSESVDVVTNLSKYVVRLGENATDGSSVVVDKRKDSGPIKSQTSDDSNPELAGVKTELSQALLVSVLNMS